jgi:hypothetical protein
MTLHPFACGCSHDLADAAHQFDAINNHAIFNRSTMGAWVKEPALFFTVLRNPTTQAASAYDYYSAARRNYGEPSGCVWEDHIAAVREAAATNKLSDFRSLFVNPQAHDLGWYHTQPPSTGGAAGFAADDHDAAVINDRANRLASELDHVLIAERMEASLVLMRRAANLSLPELVYTSLKLSRRDPAKCAPSVAAAETLKKLLLVDYTIYDRFLAEFEQKWAEQTVQHPELLAEVEALQCMNGLIAREHARRSWFKIDSLSYTKYLHEKSKGSPSGVEPVPPWQGS